MEVGKLKLRKCLVCDSNDNVVSVAKKLKLNKEKHIIVIKSKSPVGLISVTDICNRVVAENKNLTKTKAKDIMTHSLIIFDEKQDACNVYIEMLKRGILSCPVTSKKKLKGIIDLKEILTHVIQCNMHNGKK